MSGTTPICAAEAAFPLLHSLFHPGEHSAYGPEQGLGLAIAGNRIVVGAARAGQVYKTGVANVYEAGTGRYLLSLTNPSPHTSTEFGWGLAMSGNLVAVCGYWENRSATNPARAYVFDLNAPNPQVPVAALLNPHYPPIGDNFGMRMAVSGTRVVVSAMTDDTGATDAGIVHVYDLSSPTPALPLVTLTNPTPHAMDYYGIAVAISGTRVLVGASRDDALGEEAGIAYLYDLASEAPEVPVLTLTNQAAAPGDYFGGRAVLAGTKALVYGPHHEPGRNSARAIQIFDLASATPAVPTLILTNPGSADNGFGPVAVSESGQYVVVGAPLDDVGVTDSGSAFVYDVSGPSPTVPIAVLNRPIPAAGQTFSFTVAISRTTAVVGAPWDDTRGPYGGAAYVYGLRPALALSPIGAGQGLISWTPTNAPGFVLQYTDSHQSTNWADAPSGAANPVTVFTTNAGRYYRLRQP